jgi:hypothetical protein
MRKQTYAIAIVMLNIIVASLYYGTLVVYGSSEENDDENDDENDPCYYAGYEDGAQ